MTHCIVCGKPTSSCCSRCESVFYCSPVCQKSHWSTHRARCLPLETNAIDLLKAALQRKYPANLPAALRAFPTISKSQLADLLQITDPQRLSDLFAALDVHGNGLIKTADVLNAHLDQGYVTSASKVDTSYSIYTPSDPSPRVAAILAFRHGQYREVLTLLDPIMNSYDKKYPEISDSLLFIKTAVLLGDLSRARPVFATLVHQLNESPDPDEMTTEAGDLVRSDAVVNVAPSLWGTVLSESASLADALGEGATVGRQLLERLLRWTRRTAGEDALVVSDVLTRLAGLLLKVNAPGGVIHSSSGSGSHSTTTRNPVRDSARINSSDQVIQYLTRALEIRTHKLPNTHARVADAQGNLGVALRAAGRLREASEAWKQCLEVREVLFSRGGNAAEEKKLADAEFAVATLASELGDLAEARRMMKRCYERRTKLFGLGHEDVIEAGEKLNILVAANPLAVPLSSSAVALPSAAGHRVPQPATTTLSHTAPTESAPTKSIPGYLPRVLQMIDGRVAFNPRFIYILNSLKIHNVPVMMANGEIVPNETVLRLLDSRTGKRVTDSNTGYPIYVLNPLLLEGSSALEAYGLWEINGGVEVVDRDLQPLRFLPGKQVEKIDPTPPHITEVDAEVSSFDAAQVVSQVENSAADLQRRLILLDVNLVKSVDIEPITTFSEFPKSLRTTLNRLRYYLVFSKKMSVNLATLMEIHRALESVMESDKFFKILRSLHKVAIALQRIPATSKDLQLFTLNEVLDIKGNQVSVAHYFVQQLKQQKAGIWPDFLPEINATLTLTETSAETVGLANRFIETSNEITRLQVLIDDLPSSDPLKAESDYLKNILPAKTSALEIATKKITETFLDLRAALGLPITGQMMAREIAQLIVTLKQFVEKLRRADNF